MRRTSLVGMSFEFARDGLHTGWYLSDLVHSFLNERRDILIDIFGVQGKFMTLIVKSLLAVGGEVEESS